LVRTPGADSANAAQTSSALTHKPASRNLAAGMKRKPRERRGARRVKPFRSTMRQV
jgi:hypothetical protein